MGSRAAGVLMLLSLAGCASYTQRITQVRAAYYENGLVSADQLVQTAIRKDRLNADVLRLDQAMLQLVSGDPRTAEQTLRQVRDRFDELEQETIAEKTLTYLWDDTRRPYSGDPHEKILIRTFLALGNLLHDGGDAEAYCLQMIDKQQQLIDAGRQKNGENPRERYPRVALSPYLRGVLREATHNSYDDARRSYETVLQWQPSLLAARADLDRATRGHHSARGNGVLYVFALVGRGPYKEAVSEIPTTASLLIAGEIVSAAGEHTLPPNVAAIQVPRIVASANQVQGVAAWVDRQAAGYTETVTDITHLAIEQNAIEHPYVMARAVARRFLKKGMIYGTKEITGTQRNSLSNVAIDVAGIVWEATEQADTRCWGLLPDKIQVLRIELPAGEHELALAGVNATGSVAAQPVAQRLRVDDGCNTYVLASFPQLQAVGKVLVSQPR